MKGLKTVLHWSFLLATSAALSMLIGEMITKGEQGQNAEYFSVVLLGAFMCLFTSKWGVTKQDRDEK